MKLNLDNLKLKIINEFKLLSLKNEIVFEIKNNVLYGSLVLDNKELEDEVTYCFSIDDTGLILTYFISAPFLLNKKAYYLINNFNENSLSMKAYFISNQLVVEIDKEKVLKNNIPKKLIAYFKKFKEVSFLFNSLLVKIPTCKYCGNKYQIIFNNKKDEYEYYCQFCNIKIN